MIFLLNIQTKTLGSREFAAEFNAIIEKINQINFQIGNPSLNIYPEDIPHKYAGDFVDYEETNLITDTINAIIALNPASEIDPLALTPETENSEWTHTEFNATVSKINELINYFNSIPPVTGNFFLLENGTGFFELENSTGFFTLEI